MMENAAQDRFLAPDTRVRRDAEWDDGEFKSEFGVVVHCWKDEKTGMFDCYVAFFGFAGFPTDQPAEKPYVLRYAAVSLTSA